MKKKWIIGIFLSIFLVISGLVYKLTVTAPVELVYMADSKYLPYMMVSLHSAIKNKNDTTKYRVHVIAQDFSADDIKQLKQMEREDIRINIYPSKELKLDFSHLGRFASFQISLQKLFIADYLPKINKVLYLDADTLVQKDLREVYETPLDDNYVAAVKDGLMYQYPEHIKEIGLEWRKFYFNSGVMLLNLKKIRKDQILQTAVIYFNTHQEVFGDQDVLNVVFRDKVKPLSYRYNCNSTFFEEKDIKFLSEFYGEQIPESAQKVYETATILHFAGYKPWTKWFNHPYLKSLWQQYADEKDTKYNKKD